MKRKFFVFVLIAFTLSLTSCDWYSDPEIIGHSKIELANNGRFACEMEDLTVYYIDSLLTIKDGIKSYETPACGNDVTVFTFNKSNKFHFYKGIASSEQIKKVYFQGDTVSGTLNFIIIFIVVILLYGWVRVGQSTRAQIKKEIEKL